MKAFKLKFLIIILNLLSKFCIANQEKTIQKFIIYPTDTIYINMDNFLPYGNFLNDLQIT